MRPSLLLLLLLPLIAGACSTSEKETKLVLLSTADVHGYVFPWDYYNDQPEERYSLLKAATIIDSVRSQNPHTLALDAGDWLQGNPFAEYFARVDTTLAYPFLSVVDALDFSAVVVGNHEFNFGLEHLHFRMSQSDTPFLAANALHSETGQAAYTPWLIKEVDGYKIGILGLTTPGSAIWDRPRLEGRLRFEDGVESARRYVPEMLENGAEVIILVIHSGFEGSTSYTSDVLGEEHFGRAIADEVPGIHAMVTSHTHRLIDDLIYLSEANPQGVAVTQPGRWASHIGYTELLLSRDATGTVQVAYGKNIALPVEGAKPHTALYEQFLGEHELVRSHMQKAIATTDSVWSSSDARLADRAITDLIQYVQRRATGADLSGSAIFHTDAAFTDGIINRGSLARVYPFENTLFKLRISGAVLREYLEFSARYYETYNGDGTALPQPAGHIPGFNFDVVYGANYQINLRKPAGERIENLRVNGRPVRDSDSFTIALNSYRAVGGGDYHMIAGAEVVGVIDTSVRLLVEQYLLEKGHINPQDVARKYWQIVY
ncbi:MAG: 5'-nucleotidase C-terminal domain-containing protein [Candidatus Cyclonatronum sp.]|uniref:bifunctional metallophosphatase/5'-nucleotidase n=1 Tax=Cyclonatronum sp. TaxID=3024185 RepID=UPI0025BC7C01|nr:5'-nucleotidase C-terminal domain-containing protein [Cyclonatronum sp.]MCC5932751.1 5'-nucleotidase C-terminal domain-containing protein [Balneolales bacterium]MCH8486116.1 5'-nucleotidase C-terminal domain-containing protein [Cyclonatronum sp.]